MRSSIIIATNAIFLIGGLLKILRDAGKQVYVAATDDELAATMKATGSRFVLIEHCFHDKATDVFVQRMKNRNRSLHIAVWASVELNPLAAARFIHAGAESYFTLRGTDSETNQILGQIMQGRSYRPADVETVFDNDSFMPVIGEELTKREIEVLKLTAEGKNREQIARILSMTVSTVKFHRMNIYRKCGGNTPVDMQLNGIKQGIIRPEDLG
jgi:DNA-binding NarL/FixJ family response regulator